MRGPKATLLGRDDLPGLDRRAGGRRLDGGAPDEVDCDRVPNDESRTPLVSMLAQLDLRLLRCYVVVAEERHFGRAARRLGLGQPAVSKIIRAFERQMGVPLLVRDKSRGVELTAAGQIALAEGRCLITLYQRMIDQARHAGLISQACSS